MNIIHLDSRIAGAKTLWVLRFAPPTQGHSHVISPAPSNRVLIELLIPTPLHKDEWMVVSRRQNEEWLDSLIRFQQMCEEAKARCKEQLMSGEENADHQAQKVTEEILNITALIHYFNELLKRFRPPPTHEP